MFNAIACPPQVITECTVVGDGNEVTFNPNSPPSTAPTAVKIDPNPASLDISCPAQTQCTAVEIQGSKNGNPTEMTFDPTQSHPSPTLVSIDPGGFGLYVACPITSQCTAVGFGSEVTFNPHSPDGAKSKTFGNSQLGPVACPPHVTTQCTAVLSDTDAVVTFNPQSPGAPTPVDVDSNQSNDLLYLSCPAVTLCSAADATGVVTFDPYSSGAPKRVALPPPSGAPILVGVSCPVNPAAPRQIECIALYDGGVGGVAWIGTGTAPTLAKPSCTVGAKSNRVLLPAKNSQPPTGDEGKLIFDAKCDPSGSVGLTGKLTEVTEKNGKKLTTTFTLPRVNGWVQAGVMLALTVTLPRAAVSGLEHGAQESVAMTLTATNPAGAATALTKITKLVGVRQ